MEHCQLIEFVDLHQWNTRIVMQELNAKFVRTAIPKTFCSMEVVKYVNLQVWNAQFVLKNATNFKLQVRIEMQKRGYFHYHYIVQLGKTIHSRFEIR